MNNNDLNKTIVTNFDLEETVLQDEETGFWDSGEGMDSDATVFQDDSDLEATVLKEEEDACLTGEGVYFQGEETVLIDDQEKPDPGSFVQQSGQKMASGMTGFRKPAQSDLFGAQASVKQPSAKAAQKQVSMDFSSFEEKEPEVKPAQAASGSTGGLLDRSVEEMNRMINGSDMYTLPADVLNELKPLFSSRLFVMYYRSRPEKLEEWVNASAESKTAQLLKVCEEIGRALIGSGRMISDLKQGTIYEADVFCVPELRQANIQGLHSWLNEIQEKGQEGKKMFVRLVFRGTRDNVAPTLQASNVLDGEFGNLQIRREIKFMQQQPTLDQTISSMPALAKLFAPRNYSSLMAASDQMQLTAADKRGAITPELVLTAQTFVRTNAAEQMKKEIEALAAKLEQSGAESFKDLLMVKGCKQFVSELDQLHTVRLAEEIINLQAAGEQQRNVLFSLLKTLEQSGDLHVNAALAELQKEGLEAGVGLWTRQGLVQESNDWWMKKTKADRISECLEAAQNLSLLYFFKPKLALSQLARMPYSFILLNILLGADLLRKEEPWNMKSGTRWSVPFIRNPQTHNAWVKACEVMGPCAQVYGLQIDLNPDLCWQPVMPEEWEPAQSSTGH